MRGERRRAVSKSWKNERRVEKGQRKGESSRRMFGVNGKARKQNKVMFFPSIEIVCLGGNALRFG